MRAVDGVSLDLMPGETVGLVGESGCGKSTLGRGVIGLLPEGAGHAGEVSYKGRNILDLKPKELRELRGPDLGMIFQEPMTRLNPLMKISAALRGGAARSTSRSSARRRRATRALETLRGMGIPPTRYGQYPHEFSGGMRQRIMIALALVLRPAVVVADEPTTALDVLVEAQILRILADLRRNFDTALLLITHNLGIVAEACDRVAVMYAGPDRRAGPGLRRHDQAVAPVLARAAALDDLALDDGAALDPGRAAGPRRPAAGLPLPPALPGRDEGLRRSSGRRPIATGPARRSECWLHAKEDIPAGMEAPLEREALAAAEEA